MFISSAIVWLSALAPITGARPSNGFSDIARYLHLRADDGVILDKSTALDTNLENFTLFKL